MTPAPFQPTRWTLVLRSRGTDDVARAALSELCGTCYEPVVAFLTRRLGHPDAAREAAHEFFAALLGGSLSLAADPDRGRFRSYLLGAVKHFLANRRAAIAAQKRGGTVDHVPLDEAMAVAHDTAATDSHFDRDWAFALISRALATLEAEMSAAGKSNHFTALQPWLIGGGEAPQSAVAQALGLSENALRVALHRLRQRFRDHVRREVAQTVDSPADVSAELRHLVDVVATSTGDRSGNPS